MRCLFVVILASVAVSGCTVVAIASTKQEVVNEETIATRARQPADVNGSQCFVDNKVRTTRKANVESWGRIGGGFDALLFGLIALFPGNAVWAGPLALDGGVAFVYSMARHNSISHDEGWHETTETRPCEQ